MAKIKIKGVNGLIGTRKIEPREIAVDNTYLYYVPANGNDTTAIFPVSLAVQDTYQNVFLNENHFKVKSAQGFQIQNSDGDLKYYASTDGLLSTQISTFSSNNLVNKAYVDAVVQGLNIKKSVLVATTESITLSGLQTIDGISVGPDDRVLVKNQSPSHENGIYIARASSWSRAEDANSGSELVSAFVFVEQGDTQADTGWVCITNSISEWNTNITWSQFSGAGTYTADGNTLKLSGTQFSIKEIAASSILGNSSTTTTATPSAISMATLKNMLSLGSMAYASTSSYQPIDADLTKIAALPGTTGLLKKIGANDWTLDTASYTTSSGVTSVGLSLPSIFTVTGSPVTTSGTLTGSLATQNANTIFAGPVSGTTPAAPTFRALVAADIPNLNTSKLTTGTLGAARGGTGQTTYAKGDLLYASTTNTLDKLPIGTTGHVLKSNAGTVAWAAISSSDVTSALGYTPYSNTNPNSYTSSSGVTSVSAGNGMDFNAISSTGSVTLGTPSTLTSGSTNAVTPTSHTHQIMNYSLSGTSNQITITGESKVLGAAGTLSLPDTLIAPGTIQSTGTLTVGVGTTSWEINGGTTNMIFTAPGAGLITLPNSTVAKTIAFTTDIPAGVDVLTCSTAQATAAKTVSAPNFTLADGKQLYIKFTNANTAASVTLNIQSTGAHELYVNEAQVGASNGPWVAGDVIRVAYNLASTRWDILENLTTRQYYGNSNTVTDGVYLSTAQSITGVKTFNNATLRIKGSGTGITTFTNSNTTASNYTIIIPAVNSIMNLSSTTTTAGRVMLSTETAGLGIWSTTSLDSMAYEPNTGTTSITTLGTITTGTWKGTEIGAQYGGTGQTTYAKGDLLYASTTNTLDKLPIGTTGHVLKSNAGTVAWAAISSSDVTSALGYTPYSNTNPTGYITGISSADVTSALGYTPYSNTNPNSYTTSSGVTSVSAGTGMNFTTINGTGSVALRSISSGSTYTGAIYYNGTTTSLAAGQFNGNSSTNSSLPSASTVLKYNGHLYATQFEGIIDGGIWS